MTITALPTPTPNRLDSPTTFDTRASALLGALPTMVTEINATTQAMNDSAAAAAASSASAAAAAANSSASAISSSASASLASTFADAAANAVDAAIWVSGQSYAQYACAISPITLQTYRRTSAGSGVTDPSADTVNWEMLGRYKVLVSSRTANTQIGVGDAGRLIDITSGTFTQTFSSAATLGNGWWCYYRNSGTGTVTLSGLGITVRPAETVLLQCDGTTLRCASRSISHPPVVSSGTPVEGNRHYITGGTTSALIPTLTEGALVSIQTVSGNSSTLTLTSDDAGSTERWTYGTITSTASELVTLVGTGAKHPIVRNRATTQTPPSNSVVSSNANVGGDWYDANYYHNVGLGGDGALYRVSVHRTTGGITFNTVGANSTPVYATSNTSGNNMVFANLGSSSLCVFTTGGDITIDAVNAFGGGIYAVAELSSGATDSLFVAKQNVGGANLRAVRVNPTAKTASVGSSAASGVTNAEENIYPIDSTRFLVCGVASSGQGVRFQVGSVSGTTITFGSLVTTAETSNYTNPLTILRLNTEKFLVIVSDSSNSTTKNIYGVTVSGTTVTVSSKLTIATLSAKTPMVARSFSPGGFNHYNSGAYANCVVLDTNRVLLQGDSPNSGAIVVQFTTGTPTAGSLLSVASTQGFLVDMETLSNVYLVVTNGWQKLSISGTTVTSDYTVSSGANITCMFREGLSNREFRSASGQWYSFTTPMTAIDRAVSSTIGVDIGNTNSYAYRNISA